jgi:hypothetical protein
LRGFSLLTIFQKIKEIRVLLRKICPQKGTQKSAI